MNDPDDKCDAKFHYLRLTEQAKARVAADVLRVVDRSEGEREQELYRRAVDYLVVYFGGTSDRITTDDY